MVRKPADSPPIGLREFRSPEEIDTAIAQLRRRIPDLERLDCKAAIVTQNGAERIVASDVRDTIRDVFGPNSLEANEHRHLRIWTGSEYTHMDTLAIIAGTERGREYAIGVIRSFIQRLEEKRTDLVSGATATPSTYFDRLNLHPRIRDVARDRFMDGYVWDAVFAASKALVNYVKERSDRHDLDGASLMTTVFSKNTTVLAFNDLRDKTDTDEQEGMMHMFVGAVLAIRNPGGHDFPEGPEQWAIEYISFLSLLAYRVQEAKRRK